MELATELADLLHKPGTPEHSKEEQLFYDFASMLGGMFEAIEIAEEEIAAAKQRHPQHDSQLDKCFGILKPSPVIRHHGHEFARLHRAHCRELLDRVATLLDKDPQPIEAYLDKRGTLATQAMIDHGTKAEACISFSQTSLLAPLYHDAYVAYMLAFRYVYPDKFHLVIPDKTEFVVQERLHGESATLILEKVCKKLANDRRGGK